MTTRRKLLLLPAFATCLLAGCAHHYQAAYYPPPPPAAGPDAFYQHGLHDGFDAARHDVRHNDPPNFDRHRNFRNPPVPDAAINEYRQAFREGYNNFLHGFSTGAAAPATKQCCRRCVPAARAVFWHP